MKRKYVVLLMLVSILAIGMVLPVAADSNPDDNYDDSGKSGSTWIIVLSETHYDDCQWEIVIGGTGGWSTDDYILVDWPGGTIQIHIYDRFWYGDFYSVWILKTTAPGFTLPYKVGESPEVETDWHHGGTCPFCGVNLPCPVTDPKHTGVGNVWSDAWFHIYLPAGSYTFRVRNELFQKLAMEGFNPAIYPGNLHLTGCPATGLAWSPSGFYIGFHTPEEVPEFGFSVPTITAIAAAIFVFIERKFRKKVY